MLRSVGTRAFPRAGTLISIALATRTQKGSDSARRRIGIKRKKPRFPLPGEIVSGGERGGPGGQDGVLGQLLHTEEGSITRGGVGLVVEDLLGRWHVAHLHAAVLCVRHHRLLLLLVQAGGGGKGENQSGEIVIAASLGKGRPSGV